MARIICLAWLALALCAQAVTVGWRIPIKSISDNHAEDPKVRRLDSPPGKSAFFEAGDELWDVSTLVLGWLGHSPEVLEVSPAQRRWSGEWMVWNARSGMLVVRGPGADIAMIEMGLEQIHPPEVLRTKIDMGMGRGARSWVSLLSRSGEEASLELDQVNLKLTAVSSGSKGILDVNLSFAWPVEGKEAKWNVETALTVLDGRRSRFVAQGRDDTREELFITVTREFGQGVPASQFRWKEEKAGVIPWPESSDEVLKIALESERQIGVYKVQEDFLTRLGMEEGKELPKESAPALLGLSPVEDLVDIRPLLEQNGIKLKGPESFAVFHARSKRVVLVSNELNQDLFDVIVNGGSGCFFPDIWCEVSEESGGWGVVCRSGEKARLWQSAAGVADLGFEITPTEYPGNLFEASYQFDILISGVSAGRVKAKGVFTRDLPQIVATTKASDELEKEIALTIRYHER
jgi:hypothetical protein